MSKLRQGSLFRFSIWLANTKKNINSNQIVTFLPCFKNHFHQKQIFCLFAFVNFHSTLNHMFSTCPMMMVTSMRCVNKLLHTSAAAAALRRSPMKFYNLLRHNQPKRLPSPLYYKSEKVKGCDCCVTRCCVTTTKRFIFYLHSVRLLSRCEERGLGCGVWGCCAGTRSHFSSGQRQTATFLVSKATVFKPHRQLLFQGGPHQDCN